MNAGGVSKACKSSDAVLRTAPQITRRSSAQITRRSINEYFHFKISVEISVVDQRVDPRAEQREVLRSGKRVSNTLVTYPQHMHNQPKGWLIRDKLAADYWM